MRRKYRLKKKLGKTQENVNMRHSGGCMIDRSVVQCIAVGLFCTIQPFGTLNTGK